VAPDPDADPAPPLPPADLPRRSLPIEEKPAGTSWWRLHRLTYEPLFFGPRPGDPPKGRFDAPDGSFTICYLGASSEASFAEAFLRGRGGIFEDRDLISHAFSEIESAQPLRMAQLHGPGLLSIGATAAIASGPYKASRLWSFALHGHPDQPDGISYRARHDDDTLCAAIYERAKAKLVTRSTEPMLQDLDRLRRFSLRYGVAIVIGGVPLA
jgi:RES domain